MTTLPEKLRNVTKDAGKLHPVRYALMVDKLKEKAAKDKEEIMSMR